jgi:hypothetical protein
LRTRLLPLAETTNHEKAHGRVTTRRAQSHSLTSLIVNSRGENSSLSTLIAVERETFEVSKQKTSLEVSCYVSDSVLNPNINN